MLAKKRALIRPRYFCPENGACSAWAVRNLVLAEHGLCAVMREDSHPHSRRISGCLIGANSTDTVVIDLALRIVAAEDADAECVGDLVSLDHGHGHLGQRQPAQRRPADAVVLDMRIREVRDDALAASDHGAVLHDARGEVEPERDIDPLGVLAGRGMDEAIADRDRRAAHVDSVQLRP